MQVEAEKHLKNSHILIRNPYCRCLIGDYGKFQVFKGMFLSGTDYIAISLHLTPPKQDKNHSGINALNRIMAYELKNHDAEQENPCPRTYPEQSSKTSSVP